MIENDVTFIDNPQKANCGIAIVQCMSNYVGRLLRACVVMNVLI
jgi:hypothetical protein